MTASGGRPPPGPDELPPRRWGLVADRAGDPTPEVVPVPCWSTGDAAQVLGVSVRRVRQMIEAGTLDVVAGAPQRVTVSSVRRVRARREAAAVDTWTDEHVAQRAGAARYYADRATRAAEAARRLVEVAEHELGALVADLDQLRAHAAEWEAVAEVWARQADRIGMPVPTDPAALTASTAGDELVARWVADVEKSGAPSAAPVGVADGHPERPPHPGGLREERGAHHDALPADPG